MCRTSRGILNVRETLGRYQEIPRRRTRSQIQTVHGDVYVIRVMDSLRTKTERTYDPPPRLTQPFRVRTSVQSRRRRIEPPVLGLFTTEKEKKSSTLLHRFVLNIRNTVATRLDSQTSDEIRPVPTRQTVAGSSEGSYDRGWSEDK